MKKQRDEKERYLIEMGQPSNTGFLFNRTLTDPMERELASKWKEFAEDRYHNLEMIVGGSVDARDRYVAASVVQWMGSACGFSFIQQCFARSGAVIHWNLPYHPDPLAEALLVANHGSEGIQELFDLSEPT